MRENLSTDRANRRLVLAGWCFAVGTAVHTADHLRRGQGSITEPLYLLGNVGLVLQVATITLIVTRHRLAPSAAAAAGFPLVVGYVAVHWLPQWSSLSDPVWEIESLRWLSYVASTAEIVTALAVAVLGTMIVRQRGLASFATQTARAATT